MLNYINGHVLIIVLQLYIYFFTTVFINLILMRFFTFISVSLICFIIHPFCFGQDAKGSPSDVNAIRSKLISTFGQITTPDSAHLFENGYLHLKGKIGNSDATIEINSVPLSAYVFCDSLKSINAFYITYKNGILELLNDDWLFNAGTSTVEEIDLALQNDSTVVGYAIPDSLHKEVKCIFKLNSSDGHVSMNMYSFEFKSEYKHFPVNLGEDILFADSSTASGKLINSRLLDEYDLIGQNYEVENKLSFIGIAKYKNVKDYKTYSISKFTDAYKKIINRSFLKDAKESGHTDDYLNEITSRVMWNDGQYLIMEIIIYYADGIAYPYYDTGIFEYNLKKNEVVELDKLNANIHADTSNIQQVIANLKKEEIYDVGDEGDDWFLEEPQIAFYTEKGLVLFKTGGNHGIHHFYKYYPRKVLAPILKH